jgi:general secretion pathway protein D
MVFIRATIIRDGKLMNEISKKKYNYIRADEIRKQEEGLSLMDDAKMPLLPEWNDALVLPPSFDEYMKENNLKEPGLLPPAVDSGSENSSALELKDQ